MAMQLAQNAPPGMFNMEELNRTVLQAANIPNLENILPEKPKSMPLTLLQILKQQQKVYLLKLLQDRTMMLIYR